jgi:phosphatidylglycerol:prolipoprotein diacylglycerol transferase
VTYSDAAHAVTGVPAGVPLHPVQLYESVLSLGIFVALLVLRKRRAATGSILPAYLMLYGAARFALEFVRDDPRGDVLGLTTMTGLSTSQMIALGCGIAGAAMWSWRRSRSETRGEPTAAPVS